MRVWSSRISVGFAAVLVLSATACSGDSGAVTVPTNVPDAPTVSSGATTASTPPTTLPASTTTTALPATPPPSTAVPSAPAPSAVDTSMPSDPGDAAAVGEQYLAGRQTLRELLLNPALDDLENHVAAFAQPGSEYYELSVQAVRDLVASGLRYAPNEPSVNRAVIEEVDFEGPFPYESAVLQTCDISNDLKVAADGSVADPGFDGTFNTYRERFRVVLTDRGWVRQSRPIEVVGTYRGQDSCESM